MLSHLIKGMFIKKWLVKWSEHVGDFFQVSLRYLGKNVQTKLTEATVKFKAS